MLMQEKKMKETEKRRIKKENHDDVLQAPHDYINIFNTKQALEIWQI